ncbi:MAG: LPS assembly protein LptD [Pseudomonadota bacterium]
MIFRAYILRVFSALTAICLWLAGPAAHAQGADAALLVADSVLITENNRLVAEGNVEAFYEGTRMFTDKVIYDQDRDELIIPGPVRISQANGDVLLADSADLDSKLENGILKGARYVLRKELQIVSAQTDRVEGRYTVLRKTLSTSCQICGGGPPIWQIRSDRAIHDREERMIYFRHAQLRLWGLPVFYFPKLRVPDPSLDRATGFLVPKLVSNTKLGFGIKVPFFIKIGDHADLTLTPFVTPKTNTLEFRARKAFRRGLVQFNGAYTQDQLIPNTPRHYITGFGAFDLGKDVILSFDIETTSDAAYRSLYRYAGRDRYGSNVTLTQIRRDMFFKAELFNYETLRENESNDTIPTLIGNAIYERRYKLPRVGGDLSARLELHGHKRVSLTDKVGRDMGRVNVDVNWKRDWTLSGGLRLGLETGLGIDSNRVVQDSTALGRVNRVTPAASLRLSWPLIKRGQSGASYLLEPIAQVGWAGGSPSKLVNDESVAQELDEGNLLSLSRFPAKDRRETGFVGVLGVRWQRLHSESWSAGVTLGQVFRETADPAFSPSSGLQGLTSDTLLSVYAKTSWGGAIRARGLFDASFQPRKAEAQVSYSRNKWSVSGTYVQLKKDTVESRTASVAEWSLDATYAVSRHWTAQTSLQYDLIADRTARTRGKLIYANECLSVGIGAERRFASSTTLTPDTTYELSISLSGLGGGAAGPRRKCKTY